MSAGVALILAACSAACYLPGELGIPLILGVGLVAAHIFRNAS